MTPRPLPDDEFDATAAVHRYDIELRPAEGVADLLAEFADRVAAQLGVADLEFVGSGQVDGGDPVDLGLVGAGLDLHTTVSRRRRGDLSLYSISGRRVGGLAERGRHERLLAQRGGVSICEVVVCTSLRRTLAGQGLDLDRADVRITHGMDSVLGGLLTELVEALHVRPVVVPSPDADLDGVDLGGGQANGGGTARATVDWSLRSGGIDAVQSCFHAYVQMCFERFGLGPVPSLETTTTRTESDSSAGSFSLLTRSAATTADGRVHLALSTVEAYRSDDEIDRVSVNLDMRTATDRLRVVASGQSGAVCTQLRLHRSTSGAAVEALWDTFGPLLDGAQDFASGRSVDDSAS